MSTSETTTLKVCKCPCGSGQLNCHVTTQDNPWSTADTTYSVDCPHCAKVWAPNQFGRLRNIQQLAASDAAYRNYLLKSQPANKLAHDLAINYFKSRALKTKKAELAEMQRLGVTTMPYHTYLRERHSKLPGQICHPLRNRNWLKEIADQSGERAALDVLLTEADEAEANWRSINVESISISSLPK